MKEIEGDVLTLLEKKRFDVVVHGCNCHHTMGAGIAKQLQSLYPEIGTVDKRTVRGDARKLGHFSFATLSSGQIVVNAYTQLGVSRRARSVDYAAVRNCLRGVRNAFGHFKIGMPKIGAGLGGGDWKIIRQIIIEELGDVDVTVVHFKEK